MPTELKDEHQNKGDQGVARPVIDPPGEHPEEGHDDNELKHHHVVPEVGRCVAVDELPGKTGPVMVVTMLLQLGQKQ